MNPFQSQRHQLVEACVLFAAAVGLVVLFFGHHLFGRLPVSTDISMLHLQFFALRFDGSWPLWNPYSGAGMAMHGDLQFAPLYPLRWPFFFLPWSSWLNPYLVLHYLIALFGGFGLFRSSGLSRAAAAAGAVAYLCGGFMLAYVITITVFCAACWLPILLWGAVTPRRYGFPLAGLAIAMIVASGSPHLMIYGSLGFFMTLGVRCFYGAEPMSRSRLGEAARGLGFFAAGVTVSCAGLVSGLVRASQSVRRGADVEVNLEKSLAWRDLPTSLFGGAGAAVYPEINDRALYIGGLGLLLVTLGLVARPAEEKRIAFNRLRLAGALLVLAGVAFALGKNIGWQHVLPYIPGLNLLAGPARALVLSAMGLAMLIALGVEAAPGMTGRRRAGALALALGVAGAGLVTHASERPTSEFGELLRRWAVHPPAVIGPSFLWLDLPLTLLAAIVLTLAGPLLKSRVRIGLTALVILQLFHFSGRVLPRSEKTEYFQPPPPVRFLNEQAGLPPFRVSAIDPLQATDTEWDNRFKYHFLQPNSASLFGLEAISLYNPLMDPAYRDLILDHAGGAPFNDPMRQVIPARHDPHLYEQLNVRYIIGHPGDRRVTHIPFAMNADYPVAPVREWPGPSAGPVEAWSFVSFLVGEGRPKPGEAIAELILQSGAETIRHPVRYGIHTAMINDDPVPDLDRPVVPHTEWRYFLPPAAHVVQARARSYRGLIEFDRPTDVDRVFWRLLRTDVVLQVSAQAARIGEAPGEAPSWELRRADPVAPVYEFTAAASRVRFVPREAGEGGNEVNVDPSELQAVHVRYERRRNSSSSFSVEVPEDGLLVISESWDPAWRVRVDGVRRGVLRVNGLFQGVPVSAGTHEIEMRFQPVLFFALLFPGVLAALFLLVSLFRGLGAGPALES